MLLGLGNCNESERQLALLFMPIALAVDIGGTKFEVALINQFGEITSRVRAPATDAADGEELFARLTKLIASVDVQSADVCGVGSGGPMLPNGEQISPVNIEVWRNFPLRPRLESFCGLRTFVDNDAKALAVAEGWLGAAVGVDNYIAMVVSTGVGGGIVLDGRLLDGATGNAGHIGHMVVEPDGTDLPGHVKGVLESEASGTAIAFRSGASPENADIHEQQRAGMMVGRAVGSVANLLDLQLAVIAGSVALGFGEVFFTAAQKECNRIAQVQHSLGTQIVPAGLGGDGPLIGAAAVGFRGIGFSFNAHQKNAK